MYYCKILSLLHILNCEAGGFSTGCCVNSKGFFCTRRNGPVVSVFNSEQFLCRQLLAIVAMFAKFNEICTC